MKYLKEFKIFESVESEIEEYGIVNYTINPDGSIDVNGGVYLDGKKLTKLPLRFNRVSGYFSCYNNQLTSLEGSPREVGVSFFCNDNQLTSLEGAPKEVGRSFICSDNQLTSLLGAPKEVGGDFYCENNQLTSLLGAPDRVGGHFYCRNNKIMNIDGLLWKSFQDIHLTNNPVDGIVKNWINSDSHEELIEYFIDLNVIQGNKLIMERLRAFHEEMGLEMEIDFKEVEKYYTIIE